MKKKKEYSIKNKYDLNLNMIGMTFQSAVKLIS